MNLSVIFQQLDSLLSQQNWGEAEQCLKSQLALAEPDSQASLTLTNELTELYRKAGKPAEALSPAALALEMAERMGFSQAGLYGTLLQNAASACLEANYTGEGLEYARKAEAFYQQHGMTGSPEMAEILNTLSRLYQQLEDYQQALDCQRRVLEIAKEGRSQGQKDVRYGAALAALADLYYRAAQYENAIPFYEEALEEIQQATGESELYRITRQNMLLALAAARL